MNVRRRLSGRNRAIALTGASVLVAGGLVTLPVTQCSVDYKTSDWPGGFTGTVTIRNLGDPVSA